MLLEMKDFKLRKRITLLFSDLQTEYTGNTKQILCCNFSKSKPKQKPHPLLGLAGSVAKKHLPLESCFQMALPSSGHNWDNRSKLCLAQELL